MFKRFICVLMFVLLMVGMMGCAKMTPCEAGNHENTFEMYHNVLLNTYELKNVRPDSNYQGSISGNVSGGGGGCILVWGSSVKGTVNGEIKLIREFEFYYKGPDGGFKEMVIPKEYTTVYEIEDGKKPYVEIWKQYGDWYKCEICGKETSKWNVTFYKLYVPAGSISDEIIIN